MSLSVKCGTETIEHMQYNQTSLKPLWKQSFPLATFGRRTASAASLLLQRETLSRSSVEVTVHSPHSSKVQTEQIIVTRLQMSCPVNRLCRIIPPIHVLQKARELRKTTLHMMSLRNTLPCTVFTNPLGDFSA